MEDWKWAKKGAKKIKIQREERKRPSGKVNPTGLVSYYPMFARMSSDKSLPAWANSQSIQVLAKQGFRKKKYLSCEYMTVHCGMLSGVIHATTKNVTIDIKVLAIVT